MRSFTERIRFHPHGKHNHGPSQLLTVLSKEGRRARVGHGANALPGLLSGLTPLALSCCFLVAFLCYSRYSCCAVSFWFQGGGLVLVLSNLDTETAIKRASDSVLEEFKDATQVMLEFKCAQGVLDQNSQGILHAATSHDGCRQEVPVLSISVSLEVQRSVAVVSLSAQNCSSSAPSF